MPLRNIVVELGYWAVGEDDANQVIDCMVRAVIEARAVSQTIVQAGRLNRPPPSCVISVDGDPIDLDLRMGQIEAEQNAAEASSLEDAFASLQALDTSIESAGVVSIKGKQK